MSRNIFLSSFVFLFFFFANPLARAQKAIVLAGADNSYFPFEYLNEDKEPAGFDIDLLKAVSEVAGFDVNITTGDWFIVKDRMEKGEFDMLAGMYYNPDRAEHFDFSMPYIIITHSIFVKKGNKIKSIDEIKENKNIRVVVENSSILHKYLQINGIMPSRILAVENQLDALSIVEDSYTTCALLPELQAEFIAKKNGLNDIVTVGLPILPREYSFAVQKGDTVLLKKINSAITKLHQSKRFEKIFGHWFGTYNPTFSVLEEGTSLFWVISFGLFIILIFVYFFMKFRLKSLVKENRNLNLEMKQTNQILNKVHKNETLLKRIIEFSPFPIAMIHEKGYFVFTNSGFEELFGKQSTKSGSVNHWLSQAIQLDREQSFIKSQFFFNPKDVLSQASSNSSFTLTAKNGDQKSMNLFFVSLGNGELLIFFYDSLQDLCGPNHTILNTGENRLSFIPNLTYEVRSPMNIILGFSALLKTEELDEEEIKVYAGLIQQNAYVLLQLIQNIGTFTRINQDELTINWEFLLVTNYVDEVFKNVSDVITSKSNSNRLKVECSGKEVERMVVNADREILGQIFINFTRYILSLVKNQSVLFSCEPVEKSKVRFFLRFELDTIQYQLLEKQLQPNYEFDTTNIHSGNDLSLFIAVILSRLISCKIELKRFANGQVELFFSFQNYFIEDPVAQYKTNKIIISKNQFIWENKKILVADDNKHSIQFFETIFRKTKANIISVRNGREAYEYCRKNKDIDLIIMDWLMPVMDGETSTKFIKQLYPSLPIIAVTAFALSDERDRILQSGCSAYYPKPVDRLDLMNFIDTLFE